MVSNKIRFGVIGCSKIAQKSVIPAILNTTKAELIMIGSRSLLKSKKVAEKFRCKNYGSYEDVLSNPDIDAVYISLPVSLHPKWVIRASKSGKHVLCEKSISDSFVNAKKLVSEGLKNKTRIMEGFMFRFHPQHKYVLQTLKKDIIGTPFAFIGSFGYVLPYKKNEIRYNPKLGGGSLNDIGCYPICASRIIFSQEPLEVASSLVIQNNVDKRGNVLLKYANGRTATILFGFDNYFQSTYSIWGNRGMIKTELAFDIPKSSPAKIEIKRNNMVQKNIILKPFNQFEQMVKTFVNEILTPKTAPYNFEQDILNQAKVMEAVRISHKKNKIVNISDIK